MDNDATGCCDRKVVTSCRMLACQRLGVPRTAIAWQATVLCNMRYAVKQLTADISMKECFGSIDDPLFGTGQGSGASPAIWLTLVVILPNCLIVCQRRNRSQVCLSQIRERSSKPIGGELEHSLTTRIKMAWIPLVCFPWKS